MHQNCSYLQSETPMHACVSICAAVSTYMTSLLTLTTMKRKKTTAKLIV